jgi:predicted XRE-type DNA-binding protein
MGDYKKITVFLNETLYDEILDIIEYRNKRIVMDNEAKKVTSVEEFVTGSIIQVIKWIKKEDILSGNDDLGKPFRLRNKFKHLMNEKGLKQKEVSDATQIKPSNISNIFNNENQPSLDYFLRLWVFFGCPPLDDVLYREE